MQIHRQINCTYNLNCDLTLNLTSSRVPGQFTTPSSVLLTKRCEIVAHYADMSGYLAVFSANGDVMNTQELQVSFHWIELFVVAF